jgi:hypothetical protein
MPSGPLPAALVADGREYLCDFFLAIISSTFFGKPMKKHELSGKMPCIHTRPTGGAVTHSAVSLHLVRIE